MPNDRLRIQLLSDAELDRIEETAYTLLDEVGIALKHTLAA
jgi:trimethylamine:corrinoid methyltransferase-like protein